MKRLLAVLVVLDLFMGASSQARSDFIYWTDYNAGDIRRANLDGSGEMTLVSGLQGPSGIVLDVAGGQMYWTNVTGGSIQRANLDGSGVRTVVSGEAGPHGVALDLSGGFLYWANFNGGDIRRANLDGTGRVTLVRALALPRGIVLDLAGGQMYWTDGGLNTISRANLDGSGQKTLVGGQGTPRFMTLDLPNGKMYWANLDTNDIRRANLDGTAQETLLRNLPGPSSIELDPGRNQMYWVDNGSGDIRRINLDGSGEVTLVSRLSFPWGIALELTPLPGPVSLTGYSADVICDKDPSARFASAFDTGKFAWFEAGAVDDDGTQHNDGLPAGASFVSATGSNSMYQIQPANANNVLQLGAGQTATLTLTTPAAYSTLYVVASCGYGTSSSTGSANINFVDGSTQAFSYNTFDWCNGPYGQGGLHPEAVLTGPTGRADVGINGTAFVYNQDCDFQIYETVTAIDPSHTGIAIASIDFTGAPDAYLSNIFGVSAK